MKTILKLAFVALLANAGWHAWLVYSTYFKFKDAVESAASPGRAVEEIRARVFEIASQYDVPLTDDALSIRRENPAVGEQQTVVDGSYPARVDVAPGASIPVTLTFHVTNGSIRIK
jgi:hypothetical protein